ncbi:hypothetical protein K6119_12015 [Paracrocinitomix mangrovi]|uniref:hypothetical protein n=1 Tax=Paracrocinitomix mangrovi TaxID=2862509 RepID=UPI001C8EAF5D|nr:hypothetical protein [Paracrocinitomix mangrovi]UKN00457.1 hypothetical protein K6119_12015 [Paracrocinitomix mangrovi]
MKALKIKFSARTILTLLALNWITLIVLTVFYLGEENDLSYKIVGTLIAAFILQMAFLRDQFKSKLLNSK